MTLNPITGEQLIEAVHNLVSDNFNITEYLLEISDKHAGTEGRDSSGATICCLFSVKAVPVKLRPFLSARRSTIITCIEYLFHSIEQSNVGTLFLTKDQEKLISAGITAVKEALQKDYVLDELRKTISSQNQINPPLEFLCHLHSSGILPFQEYISRNLQSSVVITHFNRSIVQLCLQSSDNKTKAMADLILLYLVETVYESLADSSDSVQAGMQKVCSVILDSIIEKVIGSAVNQNELELNDRINPVAIIIEKHQMKSTVLIQFCKYVLSLILKYEPTIKVSEALAEQDKWQYKNTSPYFISVIQKLLVVLEPQDVLHTIQVALEMQEVNWHILLVVVSTFLICHQQAPLLLEEFVQNLLKRAFGELKLDSLLSALFLARQAGTEGPPLCKPYAQWFTMSFGSPATSLANTPKTFVFLMKLLSEIVPHEPAKYLKVHLSKGPYVLPHCKQWFSDYCTLAKSRLSELGEAYEDTAIYSSAGCNKDDPKQKVLQDVERALQLFQGNNKIPASVMEASIFQKQYFNEKFIPALLIPRQVPDIRDSKYKFIEALKRAGKISSSVYEQYYKSCQQETKKQALSMDIDDCIEILAMDPYEELEKATKDFVVEVQTAGPNFAALVSRISTKITGVLESLLPAKLSKASTITLDINTNVCAEVQQIVQLLYDTFMTCCKSKPPILPKKPTEQWDYLLLTMIHNHQVLHQAFLTLISQRVSLQVNVPGLALLLFRAGQIFGSVVSSSSNSSGALVSLPSAIFDRMPLSIVTELKSFFSLAVCYLKIAKVHCVGDSLLPCEVPETMLKKYQFTHHCLAPINLSSKKMKPSDISEDFTLYAEEKLQSWLKAAMISFEEWVTYEGYLKPDETDSYERLDRLRWLCFQHFKKLDCNSMMSALFSVLVSNNNLPSFFQLLALLQELCLNLKATSVPWLQQEFQHHISETASTESNLTIEKKLHCFFRVAYSLPAHLFFVDSLNYSASHHTSQAVANITESWLMPHMCEGCFLQKRLTQYLVEGWISSKLTFSSSSVPSLLLSSLVVNWNWISNGLLQSSKKDNFLSDIEYLVQWCEDPLGSSLPRSSVVPTWLQGVALYCHTNKQLWVDKNILFGLTPEVSQLAVQFWLAENAITLLEFEQIEWDAKCVSCITSLPLQHIQHCFSPNLYRKSMLNKIVSRTTWLLYPAVCLSFLLEAWESDTCLLNRSGTVESTYLSLLLVNLSQCQQPSQNPCEATTPSIAFLTNSSQRVVAIIRKIPASTVKLVTSDLKHGCDEYIQLVLKEQAKI